jgi:hypothetical protein
MRQKPMKVLEPLHGLIDHFLHIPPPSPTNQFSLAEWKLKSHQQNLVLAGERASTNRKEAISARNEKKRQFKGEPKVGHVAEKGMMRGENPKRICSIVVMMNLKRSTFFLSVCLLLFAHII